jgi:hypothetical protein
LEEEIQTVKRFRLRSRPELKIPILISIFLAIIIFFVYGGEYIGLPADTANVFTMMLPGLMVVGIGALCLPRNGVWTMAGITMIGIGFALLVGAGYAEGIISDAMLTGLTIAQEQMLFIVCGCALGLLTLARERWF